MPKTLIEKIEGIKTEIRQNENELKKLTQRHKEEERKARTKRLIERGAIFESLVENAETLTNDEVKAILQKALKPEVSAQMEVPKKTFVDWTTTEG